MDTGQRIDCRKAKPGRLVRGLLPWSRPGDGGGNSGGSFRETQWIALYEENLQVLDHIEWSGCYKRGFGIGRSLV